MKGKMNGKGKTNCGISDDAVVGAVCACGTIHNREDYPDWSANSKDQRMMHRYSYSLFLLLWFTSSVAAQAQNPSKTILYFVHHAETVKNLVSTGPGTWMEDCNASRSCCTAILNPLGTARRNALRDWFTEQKLIGTLTHLIATNKIRTADTLSAIAAASRIAVQQYPPDAGECDASFETAKDSMPYVIAGIRQLPLGSRAVIANHAETLYDLIEGTTGVQTGDDTFFPKEPGTRRVLGFNEMWIIEVDGKGAGKLIQYIEFDIKLESSALSYVR